MLFISLYLPQFLIGVASSLVAAMVWRLLSDRR